MKKWHKLAVLILVLVAAAAVLLTVTRPERADRQAELKRQTAGYDADVRRRLQCLVELKSDGMALLTWEEREELRAIVGRAGLAGEERASLVFWMIIRRVMVPDTILNALLTDGEFRRQSGDRWLFTLARISLFRAQPYSPHEHTERRLLAAGELLERACEKNAEPAVYWLYRAAILHYLRNIQRRRSDEAAADESLRALVAAVDVFIEADEKRMLLPPPYLEFAGSVAVMPPELPIGDGSDLPWAARLPFALLIGSDLREDLRQDSGDGLPSQKLTRLLRFYRQMLSLEPPNAQMFDFTAAELVAFLEEDVPEVSPEFAREITGETAIAAQLLEELQDVMGYAEANPIYVGTNLAVYHENRRLGLRGDFRATIDTILRKLAEMKG